MKFIAKPKNPYVEIDRIPVDIRNIPDNSITKEQYRTVRANSDGFEMLYPKLDNEALKLAIENTLANCGRKSTTTYEGILENILVPLLLERFYPKDERGRRAG